MPDIEAVTELSEAQAIVREAQALTHELAGEGALPTLHDGAAVAGVDPRYRQLQDAASAVVAIAWSLQDPVRPSPYAALAETILPNARKVLDAIRTFEPPPPDPQV